MLRLSLLTLILLAAGAAAAGETLKIATLSPDGTRWMTAMRDGAREISERTSGRIQFRFYPGGVMGNDQSVLRKIRVGQLHGGALTPSGLANIYPDVQIYSLPFTFRSQEEIEYVRERLDPLLIDGLRQAGLVSFGLSGGGFAYLMSDSPVAGVESLRGHKVWVPEGDTISSEVLQALGVSPVQLPLTDVLTGLQTGLIDTIGSSPMGAIALQWHTRVRYLTEVPLLYLYGTLVVTDTAMERLSPADRMVVQEVMERTFRDLDRTNWEDNSEALAALKAQGIGFTRLDQDADALRQKVTDAIDALGRSGVVSPELLARLRALLAEYRSAAIANRLE